MDYINRNLLFGYIMELRVFNNKLMGIFYKRNKEGEITSLSYLNDDVLSYFNDYHVLLDYLSNKHKFAKVIIKSNQGLFDVEVFEYTRSRKNVNKMDWVSQSKTLFRSLNDAILENEKMIINANYKLVKGR